MQNTSSNFYLCTLLIPEDLHVCTMGIGFVVGFASSQHLLRFPVCWLLLPREHLFVQCMLGQRKTKANKGRLIFPWLTVALFYLDIFISMIGWNHTSVKKILVVTTQSP